jgi:hypothetical protein
MNLNTVSFTSKKTNLRSTITWNFGPLSYREAFFSTSTYVFNLGFLTIPNSGTYVSRNNFRCLIYEGSNYTSLKLSNNFATFTLSSFTTSTLTPKG